MNGYKVVNLLCRGTGSSCWWYAASWIADGQMDRSRWLPGNTPEPMRSRGQRYSLFRPYILLANFISRGPSITGGDGSVFQTLSSLSHVVSIWTSAAESEYAPRPNKRLKLPALSFYCSLLFV